MLQSALSGPEYDPVLVQEADQLWALAQAQAGNTDPFHSADRFMERIAADVERFGYKALLILGLALSAAAIEQRNLVGAISTVPGLSEQLLTIQIQQIEEANKAFDAQQAAQGVVTQKIGYL